MRRTVVIQHEPGEGPGTLGTLLEDVLLVRAWAGEPIPEDADALVVLGGGMGVSDQDRLPWLRDELRLLKQCVSLQKPVLGICLGSQLLAASLGGTVARAGFKEIGFYRVRLSPAAREDALFSGAPESFVAFHWHGDAFTLPPGAVELGGSTMTPLQAFRFGERAWGVQFHLETDPSVLGAMVDGGTGELEETGVDRELLLQQAERELPRLRQIAVEIFSRWTALP